VGVGVGWGDLVGVGCGLLVGVGVGCGDLVGVGCGLLVGVGVGCGDLVGVGVGRGDLVGVGVGLLVRFGVGLPAAEFDLVGVVFDWERMVVGGGVDGGAGGDGRDSGEITCGTPPGAFRVEGDLGSGWGCGPNEKLEVMA
jgi:hypothetical protein